MGSENYKPLDCITVADIAALGIKQEIANELHNQLAGIIRTWGSATPQTWLNISKHLLNPDLPFSFHQMMYYGCYKYFGSDPPAWMPDPAGAKLTNVGQLLEERGKQLLGTKYVDPISSFSDFQEFSVSNPEVFWKTLFEEMKVSFSVPPERILCEDPSHPGGKWLPGVTINPAKNCLTGAKRNLMDTAVMWRDEADDELLVNKMTLKELRTTVWLVSHAIETLALEKGSAIAIDMPMNVTSVVIYLAIVLAGHIVVSIADSFAPEEISTRLQISKAKAIFTQSSEHVNELQDFIMRGDRKLPLYSRIVEAQSPMAIVIPTGGPSFSMKLRDIDMSWQDFLERANDSKEIEFVAVEQTAEAFTNILFSSGTTGEPKAIPWTASTPFKAAADGWCHMDIRKGDVICWPTNLGWMMGPWLVYASLLNGASIALYNGSPLGSGFARFVQDAKVTMLGVIPSIVRAWKSANSTASYDWSAIRCLTHRLWFWVWLELTACSSFSAIFAPFFKEISEKPSIGCCFASTGEASNVDEYLWLMGRAGYKPVIEYCGGTEIGGGFVTGSLLQNQSLSAFSTPAVGCSLFIIGDDGFPIPRDHPGIGELALGPLMFGASSTLLNADHYDIYFKQMPIWNGKVLRRHGDVFERTSRGYYRAHGRADDTMNLGGIKVSSVEIERVCNSAVAGVLETAAVGMSPPGGGPQRLVVAVVFKDTTDQQSLDLSDLVASFNSALQKKLNPLFKVADVVPLPHLPRTATNKVMRRVLRQQLSKSDHNSKL
ncbi:acetyl-coenzyme A synthetase [Striga asiatica]|uniref:Acetyl-coenzyme A synthetase n=1 Tax=Striga asiatica TaxID=4170 RepID=A0A5A7QL97_STRAF|nr:acetyl-coenzyme A synthetase [Striga asiatica]